MVKFKSRFLKWLCFILGGKLVGGGGHPEIPVLRRALGVCQSMSLESPQNPTSLEPRESAKPNEPGARGVCETQRAWSLESL